MPSTVRTLTLTLASAAAVAAAPGAARADDCAPEGIAASLRSGVVAVGGHALLVSHGFVDEGLLGQIDGSTSDLLMLGANGRTTRASLADTGRDALAPTLLPGNVPVVVQWRQTGGTSALVATSRTGADRVLIDGLPFPGYREVAAGVGPDGTITVAYGVRAPGASPADPRSQVLRRIGPDGTVGPAVALPTVDASVAARLVVDRDGTAVAILPGPQGGVAVRWPAGGAPEITPSPALVDRRSTQDTPAEVVADGHGGAWLRLTDGGLKAAHLTPAGLTVTPLTTRATTSTGPVVGPDGVALVAWSGRQPRTTLQRIGVDGQLGTTTRLAGPGSVAALALDPRTGAPALLRVRPGRIPELRLQRLGGRTTTLRARRGYGQGTASLALGRDGRAWAVWEESSHLIDDSCGVPAHRAVRWATSAPAARRARSHVLRDAGIIRSFD